METGKPTLCPVCTKPINPRDGVVTNGKTTIHGRCDGKLPAEPSANPDNDEYEAAGDVVVLERPRRDRPPSVSNETIARLTAMLTRTLSVPAMDGQTYSEWLAGRVDSIAHLLINEYGGRCPSCEGACALVALYPAGAPE